MKKPLVDHWWTKIAETDSRGLAAAKCKLEELEEIESRITQHDGQDVASNVLAHGTIKQALKRCIEFHEGRGDLNFLDLYIYHGFATAKALDAEKVIDKELDHLEL